MSTSLDTIPHDDSIGPHSPALEEFESHFRLEKEANRIYIVEQKILKKNRQVISENRSPIERAHLESILSLLPRSGGDIQREEWVKKEIEKTKSMPPPPPRPSPIAPELRSGSFDVLPTYSTKDQPSFPITLSNSPLTFRAPRGSSHQLIPFSNSWNLFMKDPAFLPELKILGSQLFSRREPEVYRNIVLRGWNKTIADIRSRFKKREPLVSTPTRESFETEQIKELAFLILYQPDEKQNEPGTTLAEDEKIARLFSAIGEGLLRDPDKILRLFALLGTVKNAPELIRNRILKLCDSFSDPLRDLNVSIQTENITDENWVLSYLSQKIASPPQEPPIETEEDISERQSLPDEALYEPETLPDSIERPTSAPPDVPDRRY